MECWFKYRYLIMKNKATTYIKNRKVNFNYYIEDTYKAGLVLCGSEVKSIRAGKVNINESYCYFKNNELFLKNSFITSDNSKMFSHDETRDRKLLLNKKELVRLLKSVNTDGYTIVPTSIEVPSFGYIKINIALAKGKHNYDKRETIKKRDMERELKQ